MPVAVLGLKLLGWEKRKTEKTSPSAQSTGAGVVESVDFVPSKAYIPLGG